MTTRSGILDALWRERREHSRYEALVDLQERAGEDGSVETSGRALADRWQWSEKRVRSFLAELASAGEIAIELIGGKAHNGRGRRITLATRARCPTPGRSSTQLRTQAGTQAIPKRHQRVTLPADATRDAATGELPLGLGFTPSLQERSSHPTSTSGAGVESDHSKRREEQPEHLRYADELATALNAAQGANPLIDPDTYRPVAAHHKGTLEAALAIKNARVNLEFAKRYVWQEAQRFKPTRKDPQIGSLAYLRKGMITEWIRTTARSELQERRGQRGKPVTIASVLDTLDVTRRSP
jgi:hypothetical protein